jgi:hypothetical protein
VGLRLVDRAAEIDRARDRRVVAAALRRERDLRLRGVGAVGVLERLLHGAKVHRFDATHEAGAGPEHLGAALSALH